MNLFLIRLTPGTEIGTAGADFDAFDGFLAAETRFVFPVIGLYELEIQSASARGIAVTIY
ncbi:unnamed protein product [marine sediment metagenome]|uniref:Uncharacterized protein n=1 Tax=marine sediment metagenome TaxID=412755 RepID=X0UXE4_9ZZZZ